MVITRARLGQVSTHGREGYPRVSFIQNASMRSHEALYRSICIRSTYDRNKIERICPCARVVNSGCGDTSFSIWACLTACGAASQYLENTKVGSWLSGPLLAIAIALMAGQVGLLPSSSSVYGLVWNFLLPVSASLYMLESDLSRYVARD